MPNKKNQATLVEFNSILEEYNEFFITENKGMSVSDLNSLRKKLRSHGSVYKIVKNTVFKIALNNHKINELDSLFVGSNGVIFTKDPIKSAKSLSEFAKTAQDRITVKGGYTEGRLIDEKYIQTLSTLSSKEELVSKLMMIIKNPVQKLVIALNAIAKQKSE